MRLFRMTAVAVACAFAVAPAGCKSEPKKTIAVPASSDPEGEDLLVGSIVAAVERGGGVRIYKIVDSLYFPPPMTDELVMIAYHEKGNDFVEAAALYQKGGLTVALPQVRVQRHLFRTRDYRILASEAVTAADKSAQSVDPPPRPK